MKLLKRIVFTVVVLVPLAVLAQETGEPAPAPEPSNPAMDAFLWLLSAAGLTVVGQVLRFLNLPQRIPPGARPFIGPVLGVLASVLTTVLGIDVNLGILEGVLLGATSALVFDVGRGTGILTGTGSGK